MTTILVCISVLSFLGFQWGLFSSIYTEKTAEQALHKTLEQSLSLKQKEGHLARLDFGKSAL